MTLATPTTQNTSQQKSDPTIIAATAAGRKAYRDGFPHSSMFNLGFMLWVNEVKISYPHSSKLCDAYMAGHKAAWSEDFASDDFIVMNTQDQVQGQKEHCHA
jgi:hypothetical protein